MKALPPGKPAAARCKARSKQTGERCKAWAAPGREVCRHHGGKTPRGLASPSFKHGLYSKWAAPDLAVKLAELEEARDRLADLSEVLPVLHALLQTALGNGDTPAAVAVTEALGRCVERIHRVALLKTKAQEGATVGSRVYRVNIGQDGSMAVTEEEATEAGTPAGMLLASLERQAEVIDAAGRKHGSIAVFVHGNGGEEPGR
jgi:hypothetical protein